MEERIEAVQCQLLNYYAQVDLPMGGVTWVPGRSGGEQAVERGARRSDGTQAVDTHVVDVTRPRQVTGTTETTCRLSEANFSLSRFPSFESYR